MAPASAWRSEPIRPAEVVRPILLIAVPESDEGLYPSAPFMRVAVRSTAEGLRLIRRERPRVVVIDWDQDGVDGVALAQAARELRSASVLVTTATPERVPAALKCGCDAVLLKPFPRNLLAARLGRLFREPLLTVDGRGNGATRAGTNRVWPATACPRCGTSGATSFEFHSHRRMWYACLGCEHVWLGPRQE
jgi:CheY-like chemotaxis protein